MPKFDEERLQDGVLYTLDSPEFPHAYIYLDGKYILKPDSRAFPNRVRADLGEQEATQVEIPGIYYAMAKDRSHTTVWHPSPQDLADDRWQEFDPS